MHQRTVHGKPNVYEATSPLPDLGDCRPVTQEICASDSPSKVASASETHHKNGSTSYGEILRSSSIVGLSLVGTTIVGIVRTKAMAVMLGPAGFGLMGVLSSIIDLVSSLAGMGINRSGVRQVAESVGAGDERRIAVTATVLRRASVAVGLFGTGILLAFAIPVAELTFGSTNYVAALTIVSTAVLFKLVADGQVALLQGVRRIGDFAKVGVMGAVIGALVMVPIVYVLRESGVALALVAAAAATALVSWFYSRTVPLKVVHLTLREFRTEAVELLQLGVAFMVSGLLAVSAAYIVRLFMLRFEGLEPAGLYQAAWTVGGMYVGMILQAMGTDFYPRLVAVANDDARCNVLVNEQTQIGLLLALVGVLATVVLAPVLLTLLYSDQFARATEALRWICLGMALRVLSWPMGYIIVAKGNQRLFILAEAAWTVVNLSLSYFLIQQYGLTGAGIAFFLSYVFHIGMIYAMARHLSGFHFDIRSLQIIATFFLLTSFAFTPFYLLPPGWATSAAVTVLVVGSVAATRRLASLLAPGIPLKGLIQAGLLRLRRQEY